MSDYGNRGEGTRKPVMEFLEIVMSGSDPRITCNADMRRTSEAEPDG